MPIFYKVSLEDIDELSKICESENYNNELSDFIDRTHFYTCSHCGCEEKYEKSPVVKDNVWSDACKGLGIKFLNGEKSSEKLKSIRLTGLDSEQRAGYRFHVNYKHIRRVVPNDEYTMLCRHCIEKGIGRKLYKEDLEDCLMTQKIIGEFESNNNKED